MKLIDFYKKVLNSYGYEVTDDGYIMIKTSDSNEVMVIDGKTIVLPLQEHIKSMVKIDENGKPKTTKLLFNPLNENVIKSASPSFKLLKKSAELKIAGAIYAAGHMLLNIASDKKLQTNTSMLVNNFLVSLQGGKNKGHNASKPVDSKTITLWDKLFEMSMQDNIPFIKIFNKKKGKINNIQYTRVAKAKFNMYEELGQHEKDSKFHGLTFRNKDSIVFRKVFEILIPNIVNGPVSIGDSDALAPTFAALTKLYINLMSIPLTILKELQHIDQEVYDLGYVDISITTEDLNNLSRFKGEVVVIPDDVESRRAVVNASKPANEAEVNTKAISNIMANAMVNNSITADTNNIQQVAQQPVAMQQDTTELSPGREALMKLFGNSAITPQPNPMMGNAGMVNPNVSMPAPVGVNSVPMYNTGMVNNMAPMYPNMGNNGMVQRTMPAGFPNPNQGYMNNQQQIIGI